MSDPTQGNLTEDALDAMRRASQMTPEAVRKVFAIDAAVQAERSRLRRAVGELGAGMVMRAPEGVRAEHYFQAFQDGFYRCRSMLLDMLDTATADVPPASPYAERYDAQRKDAEALYAHLLREIERLAPAGLYYREPKP